MSAAGLLVSAFGLMLLVPSIWLLVVLLYDNRNRGVLRYGAASLRVALLAGMMLLLGGLLAWWGYHPDADWAALFGTMRE